MDIFEAIAVLLYRAEHSKYGPECPLAWWRAGRHTEGGGYENKYLVDGKWGWYQSRPVDETPKCICGLDNAIEYAEVWAKEMRKTNDINE